jgi:hypothetical protein
MATGGLLLLEKIRRDSRPGCGRGAAHGMPSAGFARMGDAYRFSARRRIEAVYIQQFSEFVKNKTRITARNSL